MVGYDPGGTSTATVVFIYSNGNITMPTTTLTNGDSSWFNRPSPRQVEREYEVVYERNARGRVRVRLPPQAALDDPWVPPELTPRPAPVVWPVMLRRYRSQRA